MAFDLVKIKREANYKLQTLRNWHESYDTTKMSMALVVWV